MEAERPVRDVVSAAREAKAALLRGCPIDEVLDSYRVSPVKLLVCLVSDLRGQDTSRNPPIFSDSPAAISSGELGKVLVNAARIVVCKHYRGKPPFGM